MNGIDPRPSGSMLYSEIRSYCVRVGCSQAQFSRSSGITEPTIVSIQHAQRPMELTVKRVRSFMEENPTCCPGVRKASGGWMPPANPKAPAPSQVKHCAGASALERALAVSVEPARPSISAAAAAEADEAARRRSFARTGSPRAPVPHALPIDAAPAEVFATALVETPGDLIARVRAAWPELWAAVVKVSRASGEPAGATLMRVISRGLEEFSA